MNKTMITAIMAALLAFGSFFASATEYAPVLFVHGSDVQLGLGQFPIEKKPLSAARQAVLGLRPYVLTSDALFFNYQREGKFALKLMKKGTLVLVDKDGDPRYEESCGNRLIDPRKLAPSRAPAKNEAVPLLPHRTWEGIAPVATLKGGNPPEASSIDVARALINKLPEPAKMVVHWLSWIGASALLLAVLILAFWGLSALGGSARHNINANNWHRPTRLG